MFRSKLVNFCQLENTVNHTNNILRYIKEPNLKIEREFSIFKNNRNYELKEAPLIGANANLKRHLAEKIKLPDKLRGYLGTPFPGDCNWRKDDDIDISSAMRYRHTTNLLVLLEEEYRSAAALQLLLFDFWNKSLPNQYDKYKELPTESRTYGNFIPDEFDVPKIINKKFDPKICQMLEGLTFRVLLADIFRILQRFAMALHIGCIYADQSKGLLPGVFEKFDKRRYAIYPILCEILNAIDKIAVATKVAPFIHEDVTEHRLGDNWTKPHLDNIDMLGRCWVLSRRYLDAIFYTHIALEYTIRNGSGEPFGY